ncbi:hypothetical protein PHYSODRAFT_505873 [Phytophthora sojae]|uniref:RxLR effector protein n=1 Tax=Phytophthora sojae (strain P6497) TaxID=1094619 RepID=G4ZMI6_PHYSP|nr:hypothetical protein PHYSODRAFT_505873 [Phytophthora sojae]EGZ15333.1 hypothetical protein PHYSODRAFT_505873 [Phytophthora sojae]|eukprot:XP_009529082.1 hypothetical protein PHYSODRAFT_505873 [Phytophthora sojae]
MHLTRLILLLLVVLAANVNPVAATEGESSVSHTSSHRVLTDKIDFKAGELANSELEERGVMTSIATRFKAIFKKNSGLSNKVGSTRQSSEIVKTLEKMPIVKKLETAVKDNPTLVKALSNPESMKKLARDPQVAKLSAVLEQNNVKVTKEGINKLRSAAGNDPAKLSTLEVIDGVVGATMITAISAAVFFLLVVGTGWAAVLFVDSFLQGVER